MASPIIAVVYVLMIQNATPSNFTWTMTAYRTNEGCEQIAASMNQTKQTSTSKDRFYCVPVSVFE